MLNRIQFPIYHLGQDKPTKEGTRWYYHYEVHHKDGEIDPKIVVVDDTSVTGNSLAMRRLQLKNNGVALAKLRHAVFFLGDMIKLSKAGTWFIDSEGTVFEYRKTKRVPLVFKPISQVIPIRTGGAIVEVQGIGTRFKVLHAPNQHTKYAGLLLVGTGYLLYGLYEDKLPDTVRMV
jgi:hypothetical protein